MYVFICKSGPRQGMGGEVDAAVRGEAQPAAQARFADAPDRDRRLARARHPDRHRRVGKRHLQDQPQVDVTRCRDLVEGPRRHVSVA